MAIDLIPQFEPLRMPAECTLAGETLFEPVVAQSGSTLVAGGPRAVAIFELQDRPSVLETIRSKLGNGIAGFCVNHSDLYVQDGPVLTAWSLTTQRLYAAHNLSTGQSWSRADGEEDGPPEAFYAFSDEDAPLRAELTAARNRCAWAAVLEDLEKQMAPGGVGSMQADAGRTFDNVRELLEADGCAEQIVAGARADLEQALRTASKVVYSAPAVRRLQQYGSAGAVLFSLGMDGTVYAMDVGLRSVTSVNYGMLPLRTELAVGEWKDPSSAYSCSLYYVTQDGGIAVLDGARPSLDQRQGWTGKVKPDASKVLPLSCHGKWVMGGGILGADFFATDAGPSSPLAHVVAAPSRGWKRYEADDKRKLILLSDGTATRLHAYGGNVVQRDRWRLRQHERTVEVAFLPIGKDDAPLAVLEVDAAQPNDALLGLRVLLANTVDAGPSPSYPPPAIVLDTGTIGHWRNGAFRIRWVRSRLSLAQEHLYCMVRSVTPQTPPRVGTDIAELGSLSDHALAAISRQASDLTRRGVLRGQHLPAPNTVDLSADALAKFVFNADKLLALNAAAKRALDEMPLRAIPVRVRVELVWGEGTEGIIYHPTFSAPERLCDERLLFTLTPGGDREITTDANGIAVFDATILDRESKRCQAVLNPAFLEEWAKRLVALRCRADRTYKLKAVHCRGGSTLDASTTPVMAVCVFTTYRNGR
ncbi:MAG: hypothetical protein ACTHNZ_24585 [Trinickia sp.]|uniref:hypothetical protein n=1 Tax=Trinickia sp. TaxID=2571163 RepID=UPI003F804955